MNEFLVYTLYSSLAVHVVLLAFCVWKVWQGENVVDRLIGLELVGTLTMALVVIAPLTRAWREGIQPISPLVTK